MRLRLLLVAAAGAIAVFLSASAAASIAHADIVATVEVPNATPPFLQTDLATFNVATGARTDPGVNTNAHEFHPSIAHNRIVFQRQSGPFTNAIIMKDLATGQQADLFDQPAARDANDPALAPDGSIVLTGTGSLHGVPSVTSTAVSAFPTGPFLHTKVPADADPAHRDRGISDPVVVGTNPLGFIFNEALIDEVYASLPNRAGLIARSAVHGTPDATGKLIVYEDLGSDTVPPALWSIDTASQSPPVRLPRAVNAGAGTVAIEPSLSFDGRYLAFVRRRTSDGLHRLFVWDSQTQLLLDPDGITLGPFPGPSFDAFLARDGNIALTLLPVLQKVTIGQIGTINFELSSASNVGIVVQKVIGRTRVFGKPAPKLRFLGPVPLGHFRRGKGHVVWSRKLRGRKLGPGVYQVTVRSVTRTGGVRDLSRPVLIRIKAKRASDHH
jgi:hypothetical protein